MSIADAIILSGLVASVWLNLAVAADRIAAAPAERRMRAGSTCLALARGCVATLRRRGRRR